MEAARGKVMDVSHIREDFAILRRTVGGRPLIYFDNAATTHKPRQVLDTVRTYYELYNANIHRSPHTLGQQATDLYEQAHRNVARFLGAEDWREIVFVRNSTEAINLVMYALLHSKGARVRLAPGDEVLLTVTEHHSNLVPWQMAREYGGVVLKVIDVAEDSTLDLDALRSSLTGRTRLVCCAHVSNVLGTVHPVREIGRLAHEAGALFLVDGAQSVPHLPLTVQEIDCDFLAFSGHKMMAPMGIGGLYGRREWLEEMAPFLYGGDMIEDVTLDGATWNELPYKYEAGTPNVCGGVALGGAVESRSGHRLEGAIDYLERLGMEAVHAHEVALIERALQGLRRIPGVRVYGPPEAERRCGIVTYGVEKDGEWVDAHLVAQLLNDEGIAVRAGGHCAYPLTRRLGVAGTVRASFYVYNTVEEVDRFLEVMDEIVAFKLL